jgi:MFS family permease
MWKLEKQNKSLVYLSIAAAFYFLASSVIGIFLPSYYLELGLSINQIIILVACVVSVIGLLPILTLKFLPKLFEKLLIVGIFFNVVFFALLMFVKDPLILGLVDGISMATFWPSFNLLIYRLTGTKRRGMVASLLYIIIPTLVGIIGPVIGGAFIHFFNFNSIFILGIIFLSVALIFSFKIGYKPVTGGFTLPKKNLFLLFALIVVMAGATDIGWIVYPLFLQSLSSGFLQMGIVAAILSVLFAIISFFVGKFSEIEVHKINFMVFSALMTTAYLFALVFVRSIPALIIVSVFSGLSMVFAVGLFSLYGDFFKRKYHASLVVIWETLLMFGRLANLVPVYIFINTFDFSGYFWLIGLVSLFSLIPYVILQFLHYKKRIVTDIYQKY